MTKQFTAMGIMILQEQGKLAVEDPLFRHLADMPEIWRSITIHQLLTHTSGIMHSWALPGFAETMGEPRTVQETIDRFRDQPLLFEPGEEFSYSGVGYFLLASVIEEVTERSYEQFLRSHIFEPIEMHDTGADQPGLDSSGRALGYYQNRPSPPIHMPILTGGGNLFSTVEDMLRWDQALSQGRLLSTEGYQAMLRPERNDYAYGWFVRTVDGRTQLSHGGGVPGFTAYIVRYPAEGLCVVVLNSGSAGVGAVAMAIARELLSQE